jgi:hypothetical protein
MGLRWLGRVARGALGGIISGGGPTGALLGGIGGLLGGSQTGTAAPFPQVNVSPLPFTGAPPPLATGLVPMNPPSFPGIGVIGGGMATLPRLGGVAMAGARGAGRLARAAATWMRRNPAWATTIGIAGIQQMLQSGQLPMPARRRARGITGTELKNFRRVTRFLTKYTPAVRKFSSVAAVKRRSH